MNLDLDINEINLDFGDFSNQVYYSYPFMEDENYEYQYRISIDEDILYLDEIKCNEECEIIEEGIQFIRNIKKMDLKEAKKKIINNIDLRTDLIFPENIKIGFNDLPISSQENLEEAKLFCLKELCSEIIEEL
jgi:hypothetical protein